ncbi:condensin-2 complex subunit H2 [Cololabis saira]|uniref:condensin-2 complex subunit H2 n=1 Tax=Cololabis saira TaxID=129043 RepID=UPI002AD32D5A|nr:condensin-2 complex subunit H2 [Cololabis saira]
MESAESRYAHLLQPIRELTKNWEIDVASELNDYLEELEETSITFDGGKTRLDFAEAALLIQGSACIYSKKVEMLYSLVCTTLDYVNDRKKKRSKEAAAAAEGGDAGGATSCDDTDDRDAFSHLDLEVSEKFSRSDSSAKVNVTPLPPESLIAPESREKQKLPLITLKGELVCSQKDFRINLYAPGEGDLILLTRRSPTDVAALMQLGNLGPEDTEMQPQTVAPDDGDADAPDYGAANAADDFLPIDEHMEVEPGPEEQIHRHQAVTPGDGRMLRDRRQLEAERRPEEAEAAPAVNMWALHDPYAVVGEDKPLKAGKCYKVPDGVEDGGKRKRKRAAALQDFMSWFRQSSDHQEQKFKCGPTFTDLNYIYLTTLKDKVKKQKRICRRVGVMLSEEELRRTLLQPEGAGPEQPGEEPFDALMGGNDDDSGGEYDAFPDDIPAEFAGAPDSISPDAQREELTYEDLVKLRVNQLVANSCSYTQETSLSRRVKEWEDKIRPQLQLQEQQPVFDIHDYGERIVGALSSVGRCRTFAAIVHGLDNFEACKYLLASLQLANDYTVEISSAAGLEESVDSLSLTLLSTLKATDRFKTLSGAT